MKKYKHYLGFGGALLGLFLSASVLASEIDWDKSNLVIHFTPELSGGRMLECFGDTGPDIVKSLSELGLSGSNSNQNLVFDPGTLPCFQTAGTYDVSVELWDTAGNDSLQTLNSFTIKAADPDPETSTIPGNCPSRIADSVDACGFDLTLRDKFDNLVTQVEKVQIYSPSGNIVNEANKGLLFREGLRLDGYSLPSNASSEFTGILLGTKSFPLVALAPTVQMTTEGDMAIYKSEIIELGIKTPSINNDGTVATNFNIALVDNKDISVHFTPPFQIVPKISEDTHIELDSPFEVNFELSAVEDLAPDLSKFSDIKAIDIENLEGHNFTPEGGTSTLPASFSYDSINPTTPYTTKHLVNPIIVSAEDTIDAFFSVISRISYTLGGETIMYPAGGFGESETLGIQAEIDTSTPLVGYAFDSAEVEIIGFVVEGGAIRGKSEDQMFLLDGEGERMAHIGAIDETDIRSAVSRNAFELLRGAEATSFANNNVVVVEGEDVILRNIVGGNTAPSGKNTLVIKNGNLIIDQNFTYASSNTDSFGVMLINDDVNDRATGNIFVRDNVQEIVGTYYADGGIMANTTNDVVNGNSDSPYQKKQLLLTGMLLTKNTKGGSITLSENNKYFNPWGEDTKEIAKRYDLDYVRRYNYRGNPEEAVPGEISNDASFILRMDKKASVLPPPGFEISGTIQQ